MSATYRLTPDMRYYFTMRRRYYQQRPLLLRPQMLSLVSASPLLVVWLVLRLTDPQLEAAIRDALISAFVLFGLGVTAIYIFLYCRFKANESKFTEMTFTISEDGISVSDALTKRNATWQAYPRAVRFRDGIILLHSRFHWVWLPDSALRGATPEEVTDLVQSRVALRHVA